MSVKDVYLYIYEVSVLDTRRVWVGNAFGNKKEMKMWCGLECGRYENGVCVDMCWGIDCECGCIQGNAVRIDEMSTGSEMVCINCKYIRRGDESVDSRSAVKRYE